MDQPPSPFAIGVTPFSPGKIPEDVEPTFRATASATVGDIGGLLRSRRRSSSGQRPTLPVARGSLDFSNMGEVDVPRRSSQPPSTREAEPVRRSSRFTPREDTHDDGMLAAAIVGLRPSTPTNSVAQQQQQQQQLQLQQHVQQQPQQPSRRTSQSSVKSARAKDIATAPAQPPPPAAADSAPAADTRAAPINGVHETLIYKREVAPQDLNASARPTVSAVPPAATPDGSAPSSPVKPLEVRLLNTKPINDSSNLTADSSLPLLPNRSNLSLSQQLDTQLPWHVAVVVRQVRLFRLTEGFREYNHEIRVAIRTTEQKEVQSAVMPAGSGICVFAADSPSVILTATAENNFAAAKVFFTNRVGVRVDIGECRFPLQGFSSSPQERDFFIVQSKGTPAAAILGVLSVSLASDQHVTTPQMSPDTIALRETELLHFLKTTAPTYLHHLHCMAATPLPLSEVIEHVLRDPMRVHRSSKEFSVVSTPTSSIRL